MGGYVSTYGESMCEFSIACWNVVRKADACVCSVLQRMNYYPFGGSFGDGVGSSVHDYLYSGKELVRFQGLDWLDYGARWYDPTIARWNGVDKLAEKHCENTPYIFCGNNPIIYTDPNGLDYWSTSDPAQIQQFLSDFQNNRQHDMSGWQHTTDANFLANLFYNDQTNNYVYSYGKLEGGEVVCYAHIFTPIDRNWVEDINLIADAFANSLEKNSGKSVIGSNGNICRWLSSNAIWRTGRRISWRSCWCGNRWLRWRSCRCLRR